jgi:hypothetical protein
MVPMALTAMVPDTTAITGRDMRTTVQATIGRATITHGELEKPGLALGFSIGLHARVVRTLSSRVKLLRSRSVRAAKTSGVTISSISRL